MDFISGAILGGVVYDGIKSMGSISVSYMKERLKGWVFDEQTVIDLTNRINEMELSEFNERAIQKRLDDSPEIRALLSGIKVGGNASNTTQIHYGAGDNVGGDKIIKG